MPPKTPKLELSIAYDIKLNRPGCVLIQAAMGATIDNERLMRFFDPELWLLAPTDNMSVYRITDEQLPRLSTIARSANKSKLR